MNELSIIGGGLAGSEAAWQAANRGLKVKLFEMRPLKNTEAHSTEYLAELICSNSLGSNHFNRASGLLKEELRQLDSLLIKCADQTAIPAGSALAVDRTLFAKLVTEKISTHPNIEIIHQEIVDLPAGLIIVASGPLTSDGFTKTLQALTEEKYLHFYDALSPIVTYDSINMNIAYKGSRFGTGEQSEGDYINCPFDYEADYNAFIEALVSARRIPLKPFENEISIPAASEEDAFFEGCLPIEILASRDRKALAFGPMRPIGLRNPRTNKRPVAVVQLRQDNVAGSFYNLVGFQTNLAYPEQDRVFRMIPGLEQAEFIRYGQMHRNTYIASPRLLNTSLQMLDYPSIFFAGQITGIEGYVGNIASGWLAGVNASRFAIGAPVISLPITTMIGAICYYITHADISNFQPMKANFGLLPPVDTLIKSKNARFEAIANRAITDLRIWKEKTIHA